MRTQLAVTALLGLSGCVFATAAQVTVVPSGLSVSAPPREAGCSLPVLRAAPRDQAYDELASLHYTTSLFWSGDPAVAQNAIRERACTLGADAVLVTQEFVPGVPGSSGKPPTMAGLAIRLRQTTGPTAAGGTAEK